jgi:hypothetical protein
MEIITIPENMKESDLLSYIANEYVSDKRSEPMTFAQLKKHLDSLKTS